MKTRNVILFLMFFGFLCISNTVSAQAKAKIADGIYLVSNGNRFWIEDEKTKKCWDISVTAERQNTGEVLYTVACKGYTRVVLQSALHTGITATLTSSGVGALGIGIVNSIAGKIYSDVCDYYAKQYGK